MPRGPARWCPGPRPSRPPAPPAAPCRGPHRAPRPKTLAREPNTHHQVPPGRRSPPQNMPPGPGSGPPRSANPIQTPAARRSVARTPPSTPPEDRARGPHKRPWQPLARTTTARRLPAAMRARKPVTLAHGLGSKDRAPHRPQAAPGNLSRLLMAAAPGDTRRRPPAGPMRPLGFSSIFFSPSGG